MTRASGARKMYYEIEVHATFRVEEFSNKFESGLPKKYVLNGQTLERRVPQLFKEGYTHVMEWTAIS